MRWLLKRSLPLRALTGEEPALDLAYRYWHGRRREGLLPARSDVDTPEFRLLVPDTVWIDAGNERGQPLPLPARLAYLAEAEPPPERVAGALMIAGTRLGELLQNDLAALRFTGSPLHQEMILETGDLVETYRQLLLPLADDGLRVRDILAVTRPLRPPPGYDRY
jgi:hypothetical protein